MAKKQTEMTVEEKLKTLFQLQTVLSGIDEKRAMRGELPLEVKDLEDEIEGIKTRRENIQGEIKDYEYAVSKKKGEIKVAQDSLDRYKKQLDEVRNNREYDILTKEIEFQSLEVELCNKKIKEAQIKIDEKKQEVEKTTNFIEERTQDLIHKRSELDEIMQETRDAEESLKEKAHGLESKIEPRLLAAFKRIRKSARNGLGIAYVQRDACGGCFAKIPPQRQLDVMMHKKIIVCEYCGRILIDPELAGVKVENKDDKKPKRRRTATRKSTKTAKASEKTAEDNE
jgi:predicted  nucleic acid-binding Zn-ribbon protein